MEKEKDRCRILVVDDDARLRNLLERYLEEQGFAVKTVPDAAMMDRALDARTFRSARVGPHAAGRRRAVDLSSSAQ